jgi:hypothetical protein
VSAPGAGSDPWTGPWAEDARRVLRLVRTAVDEAAREAGPLEQRMALLLRRAGPDLLDEVAGLAAGLAATLRTDPGPADSDSAGSDSAGSDSAGSDPAGASTTSPSREEAPVTGVSFVDVTDAATRPPSTVRINVTG